MHPHSAQVEMEWAEEELLASLAWGRMGGWIEIQREGIVAMITRQWMDLFIC